MKIHNVFPVHTYHVGGEIYGFDCELHTKPEVELFDGFSSHPNQTLKSIWGFSFDKKPIPKYRVAVLFYLTKFWGRRWKI